MQYWQLVQDLARCVIEERRKEKEELQVRSERKIVDLLSNKTPDELLKLEKEVEAMLGGATFMIDADYWQTLLVKIKTKRCLMSFPEILDKFEKRIDHVNDIERARAEYNQRYKEIANEADKNIEYIEISDTSEDIEHDESINEEEYCDFINDHRNTVLDDCLEGHYRKIAARISEDPEAIEMIISQLGNKLKEEYQKIIENLEYREVNPENYDDEIDSKIKVLLNWVDELRPRKPHFFNRVKLGYDWSKINQLHYNKDSPPPREVLGYRFNIFYPNLPAHNPVPQYEITVADNPEHCYITFKAGPPYEDVRFKILNRQWNMADRKTFKCVFDRGILHLYFDFEKAYYRR